MKDKKRLKKRIIFIVVLAVIIFAFFYSNFYRLWISIKSFFNHFIYFLIYDFLADKTPPLQSMDYILADSGGNFLDYIIPMDLDLFYERLSLTFNLLINPDLLSIYGGELANTLYVISRVLTFALIISLPFILSINLSRYKEDSLAIDSKTLTKYKEFKLNKINPFLNKIKQFLSDLFDSKIIKISTIILLLFAFGLLPILLDTVSEVLLLLSGGHLDRLGRWLLLFTGEFFTFLAVTPAILTIPPALFLFDKIRVYVALKKLKKLDESNSKFYENTGNSILITGASGTGKTTLLVDAVLTLENDLRVKKLLKIMHRKASKFPNFNWRRWEDELSRCAKLDKDDGDRLYNRTSILLKVNKLATAFYKESDKAKQSNLLFGYDLNLYSLESWDELINESIFQSIYEYGVAYFFYSIEKPLSFSTTGISHTRSINDEKYYFPIYAPDYFNEGPNEVRDFSIVIDYNHLRLGKKMTEKLSTTDSYLLDIGIWGIPEVDKERGSFNDINKLSESDGDCNQVNDYFYQYQTICRHNTELNFEVLHKLILDDQNIMKLNPDLRKLIETSLTINRDATKMNKCALALFWLDELLLEPIIKVYRKANDRRKAKRKDDTFIWYLCRNFAELINRYLTRRHNRFGYDEIHFFQQNSSLEQFGGEASKGKLYKIYKKVYSSRFDDVYLKELLMATQIDSTLSIEEMRRFTSTTPSISDFKHQKSFMVNKYFDILASKDKGGSKNVF